MTIGGSPQTQARQLPPYSSAIRITVGVSLLAAGVLNGGAQYIGHLIAAANYDQDFGIPWGAAHPGWYQTEQFALLLSSLFLLIGFLGLAQVSRWSTPRITAIATVRGLGDVGAFTTSSPSGVRRGRHRDRGDRCYRRRQADRGVQRPPGCADRRPDPAPGRVVLRCAPAEPACWRSGAFPKLPLVLLIGFLLWDFLLPPVGPLEAHVLLLISLAWLGVHVIGMPHSTWLGSRV